MAAVGSWSRVQDLESNGMRYYRWDLSSSGDLSTAFQSPILELGVYPAKGYVFFMGSGTNDGAGTPKLYCYGALPKAQRPAGYAPDANGYQPRMRYGFSGATGNSSTVPGNGVLDGLGAYTNGYTLTAANTWVVSGLLMLPALYFDYDPGTSAGGSLLAADLILQRSA